MSIASLLRLLWRQRRVVIPAAVVALLACVGVLIVQPPVYRASAAVVLLNPPALPEVTPENPTIPPEYQNPYSRFGDLSVIVDILVKVLDSEPVQQQLKAQGLDGTFEIAANRDFYRGPIIDVAGEGPSGSAAITNTNLVIAELERQLTTLQTSQGTDPSYWIRVEAGGRSAAQVEGIVEMYEPDPVADNAALSTVGAGSYPLMGAVWYPAAAVHNGSLYILNGWDSSPAPQATAQVQIFTPNAGGNSGTVSQGAAPDAASGFHSAAFHDGKLWLITGRDSYVPTPHFSLRYTP